MLVLHRPTCECACLLFVCLCVCVFPPTSNNTPNKVEFPPTLLRDSPCVVIWESKIKTCTAPVVCFISPGTGRQLLSQGVVFLRGHMLLWFLTQGERGAPGNTSCFQEESSTPNSWVKFKGERSSGLSRGGGNMWRFTSTAQSKAQSTTVSSGSAAVKVKHQRILHPY